MKKEYNSDIENDRMYFKSTNSIFI